MELKQEKNPKPVKNPELLKAIEEMQKNNNPDTVNAMINAVMKAKFITPANVSGPQPVAKTDNGGTVMQQETQVQFQLIENQKGEKFFPAFTDLDEKKKWEGVHGRNDVIMDFDAYYQLLQAPDSNVMGFVINPFGRSVAFPKAMVQSLAEQKREMDRERGGLTQKTIGADEKIELGDPEPDEYPIDMMAAIINFVRERDDVNKAYLRMFKRENEEKPSYLVIVDFTGDKMEEIFKGISAYAAPFLSGYQLSMMPYSLPFAKKAVDGVDPFYP